MGIQKYGRITIDVLEKRNGVSRYAKDIDSG